MSELHLSFPHLWQAEILPARPLILPPRHYVYPRQAEEVERGALEVLVRPLLPEKAAGDEVLGFPPIRQKAGEWMGHGAFVEDPEPLPGAQPFLATCALGFRDPAVPTGIWSAPRPEEICAVSGGYAYLIDTAAPERFTMIAYRPVLEVRPVVAQGLLLFVGHHSILAWGAAGEAWQSEKLSSEGVTLTGVEGDVLHGLGWDLMTDKETPFALDLRTGLRIP
jgi:hypothetical protein